ncbi:MAG: 30S ribosome-binding factor RbfA [Planctomycetota bacterium]|nr:30S ribosome-binding factor RbfA [Planctomycetota bacterium]
MPPRHAQKIASRLKFLVSHVVQQELNDPRLGFITILDVEMTSDLREAKIYFSVLGPRAEQSKSLQAIESSCGFIQRQVGKNLKLRNIPVLRFVLDDTDDRVSRIEEILAKDREPGEEPDPEEASGQETD